MNISILILVAAAFLAATMGYAVQRGATCTVAAVEEIIKKRSAYRLLALVETSVWVLTIFLIVKFIWGIDSIPSNYAVTSFTILGAALLGIGAAVNNACVFGTIARFGSGDLAYTATPLGFFVGCFIYKIIPENEQALKLSDGSFILAAPFWVILIFLVWIMWRLIFKSFWHRLKSRNSVHQAKKFTHIPWYHTVASRIWAPHAATLVIGVTFIGMLLLVGAWTYTDALSEAARGMTNNTYVRILLVIALLTGAVLGGWTAGRFQYVRIDLRGLTRCAVGGALMGAGSVMIPGGNDGLILIGMPLLYPYAWVAFTGMCLSIALFLKFRERFN